MNQLINPIADGFIEQATSTDIYITAIDDSGKQFPVEKLKAHQDATQHLAISIFLFLDGKMLLQRRASGKYHSGGLWTNACCTHPNWGESIVDCAARRLNDELGCETQLQLHGSLDYFADVGGGLFENERAHIFSGELKCIDKQLKLNPDEVLEVKLFDAETLSEKLDKQPHSFTAWFKEYMARDSDALNAALRAGGFHWDSMSVQR